MSNTAESWSWLSSYVRAWERHGVHFCLHAPRSLDADRLLQLSARAEQVQQEGPVGITISGGPLTYRFSYAHPDREKRGELNAEFVDPGVLQNVLLPVI